MLNSQKQQYPVNYSPERGKMRASKARDRVVSVKIPMADFRALQVVAEVDKAKIGQLIRDAVTKHIHGLIVTDEFQTRAKAFQGNDPKIFEMLRQGMRIVPTK